MGPHGSMCGPIKMHAIPSSVADYRGGRAHSATPRLSVSF